MMNSILALGGLGILAEAGARLNYRRRYRLPYIPRIFGTYPYREFIERAPRPLGYVMKRSFRSKCVNINRFRLRGPEPEEDGRRKRVLVLGESDIFGVKLPREDCLWSFHLQKMLDERYPGKWEVLNGGHPGYNSTQHRILWEEELSSLPLDMVLIRLGGNDISQGYAMEEKWRPEAFWPLKFLQAMPSGQKPHQRALLRSCLYYSLLGKELFRRPFGSSVKVYREENWERVLPMILDNHRAIVRGAQAAGARVAILSDGSIEQSEPATPGDERRMSSLNENWRAFSEGYGPKYFTFQEVLRKELCPELGVPYVDIKADLLGRQDRYELFYDGVHWNPRGQRIVAESLLGRVEDLGWWEDSRS